MTVPLNKETTWRHPSPERLAAFESGTLPDDRLLEIETHLAGCVSCCEALSLLPDDDFLSRLRHATGITPVPRSPDDDSQPKSARTIAYPTPQGDPTQPTLPIGPQHAESAHPTPALPGFDEMRELGRGGMGIVYAATHAMMGRRVAVKVINPEYACLPGAVERFRREVLAAARLSHPHIVTAYDAGQSGAHLFLVMEFVEGESLADRLRQGPLPIHEACDAVCQAALGVQHAHDNGLVHRDLKPHNLMRTVNGDIKVCDFGLAALADDDTSTVTSKRTTAPNIVMGTPAYMAPEQAEDARRADGRADVYSLGCTLYHLLTGQVPFPEETTLLELFAHRTKPRPSARRLRPDVSARLDAVIRKAMSRRVEDRYATPGELAEALAPFADPTRAEPRRRVLARLPLFLLLAAVTTAGVVAWHMPGTLTSHELQLKKTEFGEHAPPPPELIKATHQFKGHKGFAPRALFTADGKRVISCGDDGTVRLWDVRTTQELRQWKLPGEVNDLALLPDRQSVLAVTDFRLFHWAIDAKKPPRGFDRATGHLRYVAVSPDGLLALTGSVEGDVRLWEVRSGKLKFERRPGAEGDFVSAVAFSPDGKRYATGGDSRLLDTWDTATGDRIHRVVKPVPISRVAFALEGKWVLSGHYDGCARIHDVATGPEFAAIGFGAKVITLLVSPEGRRVLLCANKAAGLWDLKTRQQLLRLEGHGDFAAHAGDFSADGKHILTCGSNGTIHLFQLPESLE